MNHYKSEINFLQVVAGDSFEQELTIYDLYPLSDTTEIFMDVRPVGDIPEEPVIRFSKSAGSITVTAQKIKLIKPAEETQVRPGTFVYDCSFVKSTETTTLFGGMFEIISKSTQQTNQ